MTPDLRRALETELDARIERASPLSGGDINEAFQVSLAGGGVVFVKANRDADPSMFPAEARGLAFLAEARALRTPRVLAVSGGSTDSPAFLVLEHLARGRPVPDFDERLGRGLAKLHRTRPPAFGLDHDNFIGRLPQANGPLPSWAEFYRSRRLLPQLRLAAAQGRASRKMKDGVERLCLRLEDAVGPEEPPARLHGDLWGGNLHVDDRGEPCLIDPAAYGGHREVDLAMMRLFGGFGAAVFAAYAESFPLADGHEERVNLYQLYPLLVHVNLFGGSYVSAVERCLEGCP